MSEIYTEHQQTIAMLKNAVSISYNPALREYLKKENR